MTTGQRSATDYPDKLRRIKYRDPKPAELLTFLTNNVTLPGLTIVKLYKCRWQVELFFKWIKQHLRIKRFSGNTENAVKTQVWIAVSVYVLPMFSSPSSRSASTSTSSLYDASLYTILPVLSVTVFEKTPLLQMFSEAESTEKNRPQHN